MIRITVLRALVLMAAFATALTPVTCLGENSNRLPTKATKQLPPDLLSLLRQKKMPIHSPILVRVFKEEAELEVWKQDTTGRFQILKTYPICRWSGDLGPKLQEGDRQTPEGFYRVTPELMNPHSNYYLAINIGYPNSFDKANNRDGSLLMIHGDCWSSGCYAMTDEQISEIYSLARDSFLGGRPSFQVQTYPFRLTPANLARHRHNPNLAFWKMLKIGNDHFEATHLEPKVDVCDRLYVFDAQRPPNSPKPLVFNPIDKCPTFVVNPKIARRALEKQRADEVEYAQLLEDNVPTAPIYSQLDGGMNKVFLARFPDRVTLSKRLSRLDLAQYPVEPLMGVHQRMHALDLQGVLPDGAKWEKVSSAGKAVAEGVAAANDGSIYLVDLAPPGVLFRFDSKSGETETVMSPSNMANGLYVDRNGDLLMAQGLPGSQMLAKRNLKTGEVTKVVDSYQGKKLIAPNDITSDAQGRIYFTDARFSQTEEPELPNAVYRLDPDGKLTQLTIEIGRPNGIEISPDGKRLYVSNSIVDRLKPNPHNPGGDKFGLQRGGGVIVYDLASDGGISNGRVFWKTDVALPDGMAMDTDGNLYVASHDIPIKGRQLVALDPSGKVIQELPLPDEGLTVQVGFGRGEDAGTLYLATAFPWGLWRIKTLKKGFYQD